MVEEHKISRYAVAQLNENNLETVSEKIIFGR
jgi:hypothetical protein